MIHVLKHLESLNFEIPRGYLGKLIRTELLYYYHPVYDPLQKQIKYLMNPNILTFDENIKSSSLILSELIISPSPSSQLTQPSLSSSLVSSKSNPLVDKIELEKLAVEPILLQNAPDNITISDICEANVASVNFLPIIPRLPWDNPELCPPPHLLKSRMSISGIWSTRVKLMKGTSSTLLSSSSNDSNTILNNFNNNTSSTPPSSYEVLSSSSSPSSDDISCILSQSPPGSPNSFQSKRLNNIKLFENSSLRPSRRSLTPHNSLKSSLSSLLFSSSFSDRLSQLQSQSELTKSFSSSSPTSVLSQEDIPKSPVNCHNEDFTIQKEAISPPFQNNSRSSSSCSKVISPEADRLAPIKDINNNDNNNNNNNSNQNNNNDIKINNNNNISTVNSRIRNDGNLNDSNLIQKKRKLPEVVEISVNNKNKGKKNKTILVASIKSYFT